MHQPKGGYCGFASLASAFRSCPGAAQLHIKLHRYRTYLTLDQALVAARALAGLAYPCPAAPASPAAGRPSSSSSGNDRYRAARGTGAPPAWQGTAIRSVEAIGGNASPIPLDDFRVHIRALADPTVRLLAMYACPALESSKSGASFWERLEDVPLAHWSPITAHLVKEDLLLVEDPRRQVGGWLVPVERLHAAVNTVCCVTGRFRGLLRLNLHAG